LWKDIKAIKGRETGRHKKGLSRQAGMRLGRQINLNEMKNEKKTCSMQAANYENKV
jgi:hypothetical protein